MAWGDIGHGCDTRVVKVAVPPKQKTFEVSMRTLGLKNPSTLNAMGNLEATLVHPGRYKDEPPLEGECRGIKATYDGETSSPDITNVAVDACFKEV